jgi:cytochrome c-type biogenesis protein CcmH/NrfG
MSELRTTTSNYWTTTQAFALAAASLLLGVCGGLAIRKGTETRATGQVTAVPQAPVSPPASIPENLRTTAAEPSPQELRRVADTQAAPLLQQLKTDPTNAALLAQVGNIYYDAKQYPAAIEYYERSLKSQPADTSVRTDLGTAYWYNSDADTAIAQFQKALTFEPAKADTLFNLGIVKWQGKKDAQGAIAAWQKLLATNPGFANKEQVLQLIAQAQNP